MHLLSLFKFNNFKNLLFIFLHHNQLFKCNNKECKLIKFDNNKKKMHNKCQFKSGRVKTSNKKLNSNSKRINK